MPAKRSSLLRLVVLAAAAANAGMRMRRWNFVLAASTAMRLPATPPTAPTAARVFAALRSPFIRHGTGWPQVATVFVSSTHWVRLYPSVPVMSDPCGFTMQHGVDGVTHRRVLLGCYVDDLFTLYSHYGEGSLYDTFTTALARRWPVEDEGPVLDLLKMEITPTSDPPPGRCAHIRPRHARPSCENSALSRRVGPRLQAGANCRPGYTATAHVPRRCVALLLHADATKCILRSWHALPGDELSNGGAPGRGTPRPHVPFPTTSVSAFATSPPTAMPSKASPTPIGRHVTPPRGTCSCMVAPPSLRPRRSKSRSPCPRVRQKSWPLPKPPRRRSIFEAALFSKLSLPATNPPPRHEQHVGHRPCLQPGASRAHKAH
eukprot:6201765-Pleurochrysis_carterae.AAC.2